MPGAARTRRHPSAVLLLVQLLGVLVYPAMEGSRGGRVAFEILGIVVLGLALFSVGIGVPGFAQQFGGGGHARAAGLKLETDFSAAHERVVAAMLKELQ